MSLLLDENLSYTLAASLAQLFPGTKSVRECELTGASDQEIWNYAKENQMTIVSKDSDFWQRSVLKDTPPKVIWLRIGNCRTSRIEFVLTNLFSRIQEFMQQTDESCLILDFRNTK